MRSVDGSNHPSLEVRVNLATRTPSGLKSDAPDGYALTSRLSVAYDEVCGSVKLIWDIKESSCPATIRSILFQYPQKTLLTSSSEASRSSCPRPSAPSDPAASELAFSDPVQWLRLGVRLLCAWFLASGQPAELASPCCRCRCQLCVSPPVRRCKTPWDLPSGWSYSSSKVPPRVHHPLGTAHRNPS